MLARRLVLVAALAALLAPAAALASLLAPAAAEARRSPLASALELRPLHAEPDPANGGRIVDDRGREVLLRGVNVNALAEYWQGTRFRTTFPLDRQDPKLMAKIGWNAVRLLISWSRVEPQPGRYDAAYLGRAAAVVDRLAARGIYSIIDLHQDAWGPSLAARPGEVCVPPSLPALGWDGAPEWATLGRDLPRCYTNFREASPAVYRSWQAFWADEAGPGGVGIQTRYVAMLRVVARRFARSTAVAGFDVMNEPNAWGAADEQRLSAMYARALRAIRAGERDGGGRSHLVLFEPSALWSATGRGAPPDFARDRDVVYAPHIYTGGFDGGPINREAFEVARDEAKRFGGAPVISGEWGSDPDRARDPKDGYFVAHQRFQDEFRFGATLWTWRESCGDPHKVADYRAGRIPEVWGEFEVDCATNRITGYRTALVDQLRRAYVRAAPGRLGATRYDDATGEFAATGTAPRRAGPLVAFYPTRKHGGTPSIAGRGLRRPRILRAPGGANVIVAQPRGGDWSLSVRPVR